MKRHLSALTIAITFIVTPAVLPAQESSEDQQKNKDRTVKLDETTIEGRMQKPEAFYILQHSELNYKVFETEPTFIPELVESVENAPF